MQRFVWTVLTTLVTAWPLPLLAQAAPAQTPAYERCMDKSGGVTVRMLDCMATEMSHQDARLNRAYKTLMASLPSERQRALQRAQRAWLAFRDADCQFLAEPEGGSAASLVASDCFLTMTTQRAQALEDMH